MSSSIDSITVSSVIDKRLVLANSQAARGISIGSSWSSIRLGIRWSIDDFSTNIVGTPRLYCGMLSSPSAGLANGPLTDATSHFVGFCTPVATWTRQVGPPVYYNTVTITAAAAKKIGSTITTGASGTANLGARISPVRNVLIIQIEKGSPSYTVRLCFPNNAAVEDISNSDWLVAAMEIGTFSSISTYLNTKTSIGSYSSVYAATNLAASEADGALNSVCVAWDRQTPKVYISDFYWAKMA